MPQVPFTVAPHNSGGVGRGGERACYVAPDPNYYCYCYCYYYYSYYYRYHYGGA